MYGPMDYAKTTKLQFRVGDMERGTVVGRRRRKVHICALVAKQKESRPHIVGECEMYKKERDVSEEMRKNNMMPSSLVH